MSNMTEEKKYRRVSLEGCKLLGQGKHGRVYELNDEQILKVYYDDTAFEQIELERRNGKKAFVQGVPSCITFDTVETDQGYGIVFELAGGEPLGTYISGHPDELENLAVKFADLITSLHHATADPEDFASAKDFYINSYRAIPEKYFSAGEIDTLIRIIESIPDSNSFVHNDLHTQNVMINSAKELMLIDMAEVTRGHPIFDLGCTYMTMVFSPKLSGKLGKSVMGLNKKQAKKVWDIMIRTYLHTEDRKKIREFEQLCKYIRNLRLTTLIANTSVFSPAAYRICALWTKFFVLAHTQKYIDSLKRLE